MPSICRTRRLVLKWKQISMTRTAVQERLLVVDDDPSVIDLLRRGLFFEGFDILTASSGDEALRLADAEQPDLVVLDVMMAGLDGFSVCRRLREQDPGALVLMLTARDGVQDEIMGFQAGADDYVTKPFTFEVLVARIRSLLRRRQQTTPELLTYADLTMDVQGRTVHRGEREVPLTSTEFDLLEFLLSHAGQVLTKEQILERLWGHDFGGTANIVEVYVRSLRVKLEASGEPRLIQTVRGAGYVLRA
jgi:two-component system response regulator MprA